MINSKTLGIVLAAFVAGAFVASPELRAYAANTVGSADIIDESILSADIKNGEVKASDIATDAVGAAELQGVTKLLFAKCGLTSTEANTNVQPGDAVGVSCTINGLTGSEQVVATPNWANGCFTVQGVVPQAGKVSVALQNTCDSTESPGGKSFISLIVYQK